MQVNDFYSTKEHYSRARMVKRRGACTTHQMAQQWM